MVEKLKKEWKEMMIQHMELCKILQPINEEVEASMDAISVCVGEAKEYRERVVKQMREVGNPLKLQEDIDFLLKKMQMEKINHNLLYKDPQASGNYSKPVSDSLLSSQIGEDINADIQAAITQYGLTEEMQKDVLGKLEEFIDTLSPIIETLLSLDGQLTEKKNAIDFLNNQLESGFTKIENAKEEKFVKKEIKSNLGRLLQECGNFEEVSRRKNSFVLEYSDTLSFAMTIQTSMKSQKEKYAELFSQLHDIMKKCENYLFLLKRKFEAYDKFLLEMRRRLTYEEDIEKDALSFSASLEKGFEEEMEIRNKFKGYSLRYLPPNLRSLVCEPPLKYEVFPLKQKSRLGHLFSQDKKLFERTHRSLASSVDVAFPN